MLESLFALLLNGLAPAAPDGLPVAPLDITVGRQEIPLRAPLVGRTPGARLVLFVRDLSAFAPAGDQRLPGFERALPPGSVRARLVGRDGELDFVHTEYVYHRGFAGLVLTEVIPGQGNRLYDRLQLDADVALPGVQFVWLDRVGRRVQDTRHWR